MNESFTNIGAVILIVMVCVWLYKEVNLYRNTRDGNYNDFIDRRRRRKNKSNKNNRRK